MLRFHFLTTLCLSLLFYTSIHAQVMGVNVFDTIVHDGLQRSFILYVPPTYDGSQEVPLILNLHGAGSTGFEQVIYSQLSLVADTAGFLYVAPDAIDNFWNSGFSTAVPGAPDDVGFLLSLIDSISTDYMIDDDRIYSTGMSNGGFMSYRMACEASDRIAAIASVTGSMADGLWGNCTPLKNVPVMQVHGTADGTVLFDGDLTYASQEELIDYWTTFNDCPETPEVYDYPDITSEGCTAQRQRYWPCNDWSEVLFFIIDNGGHSWPGTFPVPGFGCTNNDMEASNELWWFFRRHTLSERFTGIHSQASPKPLRFGPNPAVDQLWVEGRVGEKVLLADMAGRELRAAVLQSSKQHLDLKGLPTGIYFLRSEDGGNRKLVIQR